jgi:hypothetical protein
MGGSPESTMAAAVAASFACSAGPEHVQQVRAHSGVFLYRIDELFFFTKHINAQTYFPSV